MGACLCRPVPATSACRDAARVPGVRTLEFTSPDYPEGNLLVGPAALSQQMGLALPPLGSGAADRRAGPAEGLFVGAAARIRAWGELG